MKVTKNTTSLTKIIQRVTTDMTDIFYNLTTSVDDYTRFTGDNTRGTIISTTTKSAAAATTTTTSTTTAAAAAAAVTTIETTSGTTSTSAATAAAAAAVVSSTLPTATITTTTSIPLELFKLITTDEPENITTNKSICTKLPTTSTTTEEPFDEFGPPEGLEYIFVPLGVMIFVIILSGVVLIISRRRKLEILKNRLMPLYNLEPGESGEDDWETELLDESLSGRQRRQGYQSMDNDECTELFTH